MEEKNCSKCGEIKLVSEFHKDKTTKSGYISQCKECNRAYREANRDKILESGRAYYEANRDNVLEKVRAYQEANRDNVLARKKVYYAANRDKVLSNKKVYYAANRDKVLSNKKVYYAANRDTIKEKRKVYCEANRVKINRCRNRYRNTRMQNDPLFRLLVNIRCLITISIKKMGYTKRSKTYEILGCSFEEFKVHIENQFVEGMSWDNRSEWHLDHKVPVSYGMNEEEILALNHYSNFQPLWAKDNLSKGNRYMH